MESKLSISKEQAEENPFLKGKLKLGKIHLIDLASGERVANTSAAGEELSEGLNINKSLLALSKFLLDFVLELQLTKILLLQTIFSIHCMFLQVKRRRKNLQKKHLVLTRKRLVMQIEALLSKPLQSKLPHLRGQYFLRQMFWHQLQHLLLELNMYLIYIQNLHIIFANPLVVMENP